MKEKLQKMFLKQCKMETMPKVDSDYNTIINDISDYLKDINSNLETLSLNTMKRIFNHRGQYPDYDLSKVQEKTKQTICCYFGYNPNEWNEFEEYWKNHDVRLFNRIDRKKSVLILKNTFKNTIDLVKIGNTFTVNVSGGMTLQLRKTNIKSQYRVVNCIKSSKLERNDLVTISAFIENRSLQVSEIIRNGDYAGYYVSADDHVVTNVKKD